MMIENESDRDFITGLFIKNERCMLAMAMKIVREYDTACDMVSESCLKMIDKISYLRNIAPAKHTPYILSIVRNTSLSYLRKRRSESNWQISDPQILDQTTAVQDDLDASLIAESETTLIQHALSRIKPNYRELLELKYFNDLSDEYIARELGILKSSVRYYLSLARRALRDEMRKGDDSYV